MYVCAPGVCLVLQRSVESTEAVDLKTICVYTRLNRESSQKQQLLSNAEPSPNLHLHILICRLDKG